MWPKDPPLSAPVIGISGKELPDMTTDFGKDTFLLAPPAIRSRPFHFVAQSVVPGSGVGGGGYYARTSTATLAESLEFTGFIHPSVLVCGKGSSRASPAFSRLPFR